MAYGLSEQALRGSDALVLADIIVGTSVLILPIRLEPGIRHILLIQAPAYTASVQEVNDRLHTGGNASEAISRHAVGAGPGRGNIVRLR